MGSRSEGTPSKKMPPPPAPEQRGLGRSVVGAVREDDAKPLRATLASTPRFFSAQTKLLEPSPSKTLLDVMSFSPNRELLRGTPATRILRNCAEVVRSSRAGASEGSSQGVVALALSRPAEQIDVFVSHNWAVSRRQKFLVFALQFNFWLAVGLSCVVQLFCIALTSAGALPMVYVPWSEYPRGLLCKATGIPIFLLVLLLGGDICRCLRIQGPCVFLDKTCVHQTDKALQQQVIRKLGTFLCHSQMMLVPFTPLYLTRLWTIYELACFLSVHPVSRLQIIPTSVPLTIALGLLPMYLFLVATTLLEVWTGFYLGLYLCFLIFTPFLAWSSRGRMRDRFAIQQRFADFSVRRCSCGLEEDRPMVCQNIAELVRTAGVVRAAATQDEALEAFDALLRAKLPQLVDTAMGKSGFRYYEAVIWVSLMASYQLDKLAAIGHGLPWSSACADALVTLTFIFAIFPMAVYVMTKLAQIRLEHRGPLECVIVCGAGWVGALYAAVCFSMVDVPLSTSQFRHAGELDWKMGIACAFMALNCCLCMWMFGGCEPLLEYLLGLLGKCDACSRWLRDRFSCVCCCRRPLTK